MRRLAFIITILGLFILLLALTFPPRTISSPIQLSSLQQNQRIQITGKVIRESYSNNYRILTLDNNIQLLCDAQCPSYTNKNISALGVLDKYNNKNQIKILKIKIME